MQLPYEESLYQVVTTFTFTFKNITVTLTESFALGLSGADPGGAGGPPAYFWQSQFYFLHCIQCLKNIFEIEF